MNKKIVLNLSSVTDGGAGTFTANFHQLLGEAGYDSYWIARKVGTQFPNTIEYPRNRMEVLGGKLARRVAKWRWSDTDFNGDSYFYGRFEQYSTVSPHTILSLLPHNPAVIFIHWCANFINTQIVHELHQLTGAKIVWLMLDNAPITGGCHYPWDCRHFQSTCEPCPAILNTGKQELAKKNLAFKKQYLIPESSLLVFSQNDWERARASALFGQKRILKMPGYFIDEKKFCPGNKEVAKGKFDIPADHRVIFFGATSLRERRKGMDLLLEAIKSINPKDTTLLVAGTFSFPVQIPNLKLVGSLSEVDLITAYQAADMFVCPSLEDSGPTMINQAIMCGTPVVSFGVGLGKDLVQTHVTGYQAEYGNALDLAQGIDALLTMSSDERSILARNCRNLALQLFGGKEKYRQTVQEIIED